MAAHSCARKFGLVIPLGITNIARRVPELIEDASNDLSGSFRLLVERLMAHLKELDKQVREPETQIQSWHLENEASLELAQVPGIGPITASALVASVGDARSFASGCQLTAWLGLVPRQNSSGEKNTLLGISRRGDTYLRTLLIHGARLVIPAAWSKDHMQGWLARILERCNHNVAAVQ